MRKLILEMWLSLDGYAADRDGTTDFFPPTDQNEAFDAMQLKFLDTIDTLLLGRTTYELFSRYWPTAQSAEIIADKLNDLEKIVFSKTLDKAPWGDYPEAQVIDDEVTETVRKLKSLAGKHIIVWGSLTMARALIQANIVDQYRLHICPTATGGGSRLFPEISGMGFKLMGSDVWPNGVVSLYYKVRKSTPA